MARTSTTGRLRLREGHQRRSRRLHGAGPGHDINRLQRRTRLPDPGGPAEPDLGQPGASRRRGSRTPVGGVYGHSVSGCDGGGEDGRTHRPRARQLMRAMAWPRTPPRHLGLEGGTPATCASAPRRGGPGHHIGLLQQGTRFPGPQKDDNTTVSPNPGPRTPETEPRLRRPLKGDCGHTGSDGGSEDR